ncbi:MAG: SDR family NAD(P)-dependent oxidoreductase [Patescibacteria group bacterium]|nr:SDR family NAD(P)-dependent oxidoreductase [Patescibacteria group bacterium]
MGRKNVADFKHKDYFFTETDLLDIASIKRSFVKLRKRLKKVDVLINNAGFAFRSTVEDLSAYMPFWFESEEKEPQVQYLE